MPSKAERAKAIRLANAMIKDMLAETFTAEDIAAAARHQAYLDVMTNSVDWDSAPPEIKAKFVKQPTASDDDFEKILDEARKK